LQSAGVDATAHRHAKDAKLGVRPPFRAGLAC
jgi:hypothetical protein